MTQSNSALEPILQRYGDILYRLATVLAADQAQAEATLVHAARALAELRAEPDRDAQVVAILLAALPAERQRSRRAASWANHPDPKSPDAALLSAIGQLPRTQRLQLALPLLQLSVDSEPTLAERTIRRDALLSLALAAGYASLAAQMTDETLPALCLAARTALVIDDPILTNDSTLRGHIALCEDCRTVMHTWHDLRTRSEDVLRGVLRPLTMPPNLADRMRAALVPRQLYSLQQQLTGIWARRLLLPLLVIIAVLALVWPRATPAPSPTAQTGAITNDLPGLVKAASSTLYRLPTTGAWTQRYSIRWAFSDETFAQLNGQIWIDSESGRQRVQLVHEAGGGPYEMLLADGRNRAWYGVTRSYAESIYPALVDPNRLRVILELSQVEQQQAVQLRLHAGAWALSTGYLRQAETATLQSWGRQQSGSDVIQVVGFRGVSALAGPTDTPGGPNDQVTILLSIRTSDQSLREIRELIGPVGGDQISRLVWQVFDPEKIETPTQVETAFSLRVAWNGTGSFTAPPTRNARPELPLIDADSVSSPPIAIDAPGSVPIEFPTLVPPGSTNAVLTRALQVRNGSDPLKPVLAYAGLGRLFVLEGTSDISAYSQARFIATSATERMNVAGRSALVQRTSADSYSAMLLPKAETQFPNLIFIHSKGYSHAEVIAVLESLKPLTIETYQSQLPLFSGFNTDSAAQQKILTALKAEPNLEPGQLRYTVATTFQRQQPNRDTLTDPYHYPAYGGRPAQMKVERWDWVADTIESISRSTQVGASMTIAGPITQRIQRISGEPNGLIYNLRYQNPFEVRFYSEPERELTLIPTDYAIFDDAEPRATLLRVLTCAKPTLVGEQLVVTEPLWVANSCIRPGYGALANFQQQPRWVTSLPESGPAVHDLTNLPLATVISFAPNGSVKRIEIRAGDAVLGELVESWQIVSNEIKTLDAIPTDLTINGQPLFVSNFMNYTPPTAILTTANAPNGSGLLAPAPDIPNSPAIYGTLALTQVQQLVPTALLALPKGADAGPFPSTGANLQWFGIRSPANNVANDQPDDWLLDQAMRRGIAVQMSFDVLNPITRRTENTLVYVGTAEAFSAFLRTRAIWQSSDPIKIEIAGRTLDAWQVGTSKGTWVLVEFDRTLVAFPDRVAVRDALKQMQIVLPSQ